MAWRIKLLRSVEKRLAKFGHRDARQIREFLYDHVAALDDPRLIGEPLSGPLRQYWKYRIGDYRMICEIRDGELVVLVIEIGHRSKVYR